jgi:hypothetical protein
MKAACTSYTYFKTPMSNKQITNIYDEKCKVMCDDNHNEVIFRQEKEKKKKNRTESLKKRVALEKLLLELTSDSLARVAARHGGDVLDHLLGILSLAGAGFASDQQRLILAIVEHIAVGLLGDGEDVRGHFVAAATAVDVVDQILPIDRNALVRIHSHQEETRVGVDKIVIIAFAEIVEHRSLVQMRELSAVFHTIELGRVHGDGLVDRHLHLLASTKTQQVVLTLLLENFSGNVTLALLGHPYPALVTPGGTDCLALVAEELVIILTRSAGFVAVLREDGSEGRHLSDRERRERERKSRRIAERTGIS